MISWSFCSFIKGGGTFTENPERENDILIVMLFDRGGGGIFLQKTQREKRMF